MKKRMLFLLLGVTMFVSNALPSYAATSNQVQQFRFQSEAKAVNTNLFEMMTQINVTKSDVTLTENNVTVTTLDLLKKENTAKTDDTQEALITAEADNAVSGVYNTKVMEAQTLTQSISDVITESQEEVQRLIEEERKEEEERKRKEEEERKRKEEEERKRKEEEERKRKAEEARKRREEEARRKQAASNSSAGARIASYASQFVGNPYVYGGNSLTNGIDCSHFVYQVLKNCGAYSGEYVTSYGWRTKGKSVSSLSQAQAGDIICYDGHVAIYDGNGMLIEALGKKHGICYKRRATSDTILAIRRFV